MRVGDKVRLIKTTDYARTYGGHGYPDYGYLPVGTVGVITARLGHWWVVDFPLPGGIVLRGRQLGENEIEPHTDFPDLVKVEDGERKLDRDKVRQFDWFRVAESMDTDEHYIWVRAKKTEVVFTGHPYQLPYEDKKWTKDIEHTVKNLSPRRLERRLNYARHTVWCLMFRRLLEAANAQAKLWK